jgi:hypothetical protein
LSHHVTLKQWELSDTIDRARTLLQAEISAFEIYPELKEPAAFIAGPILDSGVVIAVIVFQLDNQELYGLINDYTGLGETGEVLVAARVDQGQMVVVNPLRHDASKAFNIRSPLEGGAFPALARALAGVHGSGLFDVSRAGLSSPHGPTFPPFDGAWSCSRADGGLRAHACAKGGDALAALWL